MILWVERIYSRSLNNRCKQLKWAFSFSHDRVNKFLGLCFRTQKDPSEVSPLLFIFWLAKWNFLWLASVFDIYDWLHWASVECTSIFMWSSHALHELLIFQFLNKMIVVGKCIILEDRIIFFFDFSKRTNDLKHSKIV